MTWRAISVCPYSEADPAQASLAAAAAGSASTADREAVSLKTAVVDAEVTVDRARAMAAGSYTRPPSSLTWALFAGRVG